MIGDRILHGEVPRHKRRLLKIKYRAKLKIEKKNFELDGSGLVLANLLDKRYSSQISVLYTVLQAITTLYVFTKFFWHSAENKYNNKFFIDQGTF